ncbi:hypothetical protein DIPPA_13957 [Diplonema papillatum]|nr:hypothetical protein DIPPA_27375 [Diplonema papillatum]KAJ9457316.1 hypothetical protein DIPPA_33448 [Diplonema papillatum]KAJ9471109.1 hypothetical protein DIPPA_13957 [Diplonema papillatum]
MAGVLDLRAREAAMQAGISEAEMLQRLVGGESLMDARRYDAATESALEKHRAHAHRPPTRIIGQFHHAEDPPAAKPEFNPSPPRGLFRSPRRVIPEFTGKVLQIDEHGSVSPARSRSPRNKSPWRGRGTPGPPAAGRAGGGGGSVSPYYSPYHRPPSLAASSPRRRSRSPPAVLETSPNVLSSRQTRAGLWAADDTSAISPQQLIKPNIHRRTYRSYGDDERPVPPAMNLKY